VGQNVQKISVLRRGSQMRSPVQMSTRSMKHVVMHVARNPRKCQKCE